MDLDNKILKIHNYIYANEGLSNSETLNEFLKIFYCKILFEQKHIKNFDIDKLYAELKLRLKGIIEEKEKINLKKETIKYILQEIKDINFSAIPSDIKGHILQKIIDRSYRESRGQFFTPAAVVDFMVKMINPLKTETGADIACGTGGFMFSALEYSNANINNVNFYDISKNLIKLISMRMMFEFGQNAANIEIKNSITQDFNRQYDYILTNPPFGTQGKISDKKVLTKYEITKNTKSAVPDILFTEKVIKLLKNGGRAGIILPKGNFENPSLKFFREFLVKNVRIDAIVMLPDGTFNPYGTGVGTCILFFTKIKPPKDYKIFFGEITKLGYTFIKHSKEILKPDGKIDEDYNEIVKKYKQGGNISVKEVIKNNYNLSCSFYNSEYSATIEKIKNSNHERLKNLVKFNYKKTKFKKDKTYNYIEINDINPLTSEIFNSTEIIGQELPSRASYELKEGDIIIAISGGSIGTPKHAKALIDKDFDGFICTNGFNVVRAQKISPYYLMYFFTTKEFLHQIKKYRYGSAIPTVCNEDFENILVPLPSEKELLHIENQIKKVIDLRKQANEIIKGMKKYQNKSITL